MASPRAGGRRPLLATSCFIDYAMSFAHVSITRRACAFSAALPTRAAIARSSSGPVNHLAAFPSHQRRRSFTTLYALRPSLQHPLLPLPDTKSESAAIALSASDIQHAFLERNIDKVAFIRHGNTAPAPVDFDRELTDLGRSQSRAAGTSYFDTLYPYYESALCSPAERCVETAELFVDATFQHLNLNGTIEDDGNPIAIPTLELRSQLYDGTMQPEGSRLFRSLGYSPLRRYLENPDESDREAAKVVLGQYASDALDAIWDVVEEGMLGEEMSAAGTKSEEGKALLFFAHAIYLPSAALGFASAIGCDDGKAMDLILDTNTEEAEGYCVHVDTQSVSLLCRPEKS